MSRKVFLAFLGTGGYKACRYQKNEESISAVVTYVQEAIVDLYYSDFKDNDQVYIFLTQKAKDKHWEELKKVLAPKVPNLTPVYNIPDGGTEEELWKIFETVYERLEKKDSVIFDITHGFRSLPMLGIVLMNYAKTLKEIKVEKILYGNFEALAPTYNLEERIPNPEDRVAPILDLTLFSSIQDWAFAAKAFKETGSTTMLTQLTTEFNHPLLQKGGATDKVAQRVRDLRDLLADIEEHTKTNRGEKIIRYNSFKRAQEVLTFLSKEETLHPPYKPILSYIDEKLIPFSTGELSEWEASVKWCIEHNLIQQGITQFQEGIITDCCKNCGLNYRVENDRVIVSQTFIILNNNIAQEEWWSPAKDNISKVKEISSYFKESEVPQIYNNLTTLRNDINHSGYLQNAISNRDKFHEDLEKYFKEYLKSKKKNSPSTEKSPEISQLLINSSNHPLGSWSKEQIELAQKRYGKIEDFPFPNIDPEMDERELEELADKYAGEIVKLNPKAVHIMGEMTFTYKVVRLLKENGIKTIASTTNRVAQQEGNSKNSIFEFVNFREY